MHTMCSVRHPVLGEQICVICYQRGKDCVQGQAKGLRKITESAYARQELDDERYRQAIKRVIEFQENGSTSESCGLYWHRECYSDFTHKGKIERLIEKRKNEGNPSKRRRTDDNSENSSTSASLTRSSRTTSVPMDWSLCIFCQCTKAREQLVSISSFNVSNSILESSHLDYIMRVRLAGVNDLIATEGKYHKKCLLSYKYQTSKNIQKSQKTDLAMVFLSAELRHASEHNQVIKISFIVHFV